MKTFVLSLALASYLVLAMEAGAAEFFPIGGYSGDPERDRAAGFTVAGPVYGEQETMLQQCEAAGFPMVYSVGVKLDFLGKEGPPPKELDVAEIRRALREQVEAVAQNDVVFQWYLVPEELRHWKPLELEYLELAAETIREADPKKRPVWMYEPGHRTHTPLEQTLPFQDASAKGVYPNYAGYREERLWVPWTLREQMSAVANVKPEAPAYAVMEMFKRNEETYDDADIRRWVRHDAYAALAAGMKGIYIFSFGRRQGFHPQTREWQTYYAAWAQVARELNGPSGFGAVFLKGSETSSPAFRIIEGKPEGIVRFKRDGQEDVSMPVVSHRTLQWKGREYWLIVNSSSAPVTLEVPGAGGWKPVLEEQSGLEDGRLLLPMQDVAFFHRPSP